MSCYRKCIKPAPAPLDCVAKEWLSAELILSCPLGYNDNEVTVPAGTVRSSISQEDADEQALALAEAQLICTLEVAFDRSVLWGFVDVFAFDTATASAAAHDGTLAGAGVVPFEPSTATANASAYDAGMGLAFAPSVATAAGAAYDVVISLPSIADRVSDIQLWLDATDLGLGNGATVDNWPDLSGNGRHFNARQGTVTFATSAHGGLPGVRFLNGANGVKNSANYGVNSGDMTFAVVGKRAVVTGDNCRRMIGGSNNWLWGCLAESGERWILYANGYRDSGVSSDATNARAFVVSISAAGAWEIRWASGSVSGSGAGFPGTFGFSGYSGTAFPSEGFNGWVLECGLWTKVLTPTEKTDVLDILNSKWGSI